MEYKNEYWGGKREGAGRPKGEKTKPVRLTALEQDLIRLVREQGTINEVFYWANVHCKEDENKYKQVFMGFLKTIDYAGIISIIFLLFYLAFEIVSFYFLKDIKSKRKF